MTSSVEDVILTGPGHAPVLFEPWRQAVRAVQVDLDPHPARRILEKAEEERVDLILIYDPRCRMLENSTAKQVVRNSIRPVVSFPFPGMPVTRAVHEAA